MRLATMPPRMAINLLQFQSLAISHVNILEHTIGFRELSRNCAYCNPWSRLNVCTDEKDVQCVKAIHVQTCENKASGRREPGIGITSTATKSYSAGKRADRPDVTFVSPFWI